MAYKVIILYQLYMPSYFLGTFTEYPFLNLIEIDVEFFFLGVGVGCFGSFSADGGLDISLSLIHI